MNTMKKRGIVTAAVFSALLGSALQASALPTIGSEKPKTERVLLRTAAGCVPATASIDLDINNVRARLMTGGDMWWNQGTNTPSYEVPKGSGKHSLFAGSCWIGGIDANNQLKVAAQLYRSEGNDYWPGPIDIKTKSIDAATCSEWDRFWKVDNSTIIAFRDLIKQGSEAVTDAKYDVIKEWPARGNIFAKGANGNQLIALTDTLEKDYGYAPFIDLNGNGKYEWKNGEYPDIRGDQYIWWVFNDLGNVKLQSKTEGIGMEVQTSAFAYQRKDFMNDATFYNYRLINRGNVVLDSCFIATWTDADLGYPFDDYIGCDTARGLGVLYNAKTPDGANGVNSYGSKLPMIGVDFFIGPRKDYKSPYTGKDTSRLLKMASFSYFENDPSSQVRDPNNGPSIYNYMTGSTYYGLRFSNDQSRGTSSVGYGVGPIAPFVFYGDPGNKSEWSQCSCNSPAKDRRFIHSSGPFTLQVGVKNDITIGVVWVDNVGACGQGSFKKIRAADDIAQGLFDNNFKVAARPEAPRMVIRELDRRLIFYLVNDSNSNNFQERYGDKNYTSDEKYRAVSSKARDLGNPDSIYVFEGYRVYQLRKSNSSIFNEDGSVNSGEAIEIFQCDKRNGITKIVNFTKNLDLSDSISFYDGIIKVNGKDSGLVHSFELTEDAFATGDDGRTLVNYKSYHFQAFAYAYNNFSSFDSNDPLNTQDEPYFESLTAAGGTTNKVITAMPHPVNQDMYTTINSNYGQGVVIQRIEGVGNGGNDVQLSDSSEQAALQAPYQVAYPTYKAGRGPVDIKVIDPIKVVSADWTIKMSGASNTDTFKGLAKTATWTLINNTTNEIIYSEKDLSVANEQILEKYGFSINVSQVDPPGVEQVIANGYITTDITYANAELVWLSGVQDASGRSLANWIRSGNFTDELTTGETAPPCWPFSDYKSDTTQKYANLFSDNSYVRSSWSLYDLAAMKTGAGCGFAPAYPASIPENGPMYNTSPSVLTLKYSEVPSVDLVLTSDKSKWTRCVVLEAQESPALAEGGAAKLRPRSHASWNMDVDGQGNPVYSTTPKDTGYSYFPGYAVNQITGERLNIVFAEDSYLKKNNGSDMIWNPTAIDQAYGYYNQFGDAIFGGKHFTYILNTKYDSCRTFVRDIFNISPIVSIPAYRSMRWVGIPMLNYGFSYLPLKDGLIPTETRLRFRVNTPYKKYKLMEGQTATNDRNPLYKFTTKGMSPTRFVDSKNQDINDLVDRIHVVPNPYKAQASGGGGSYENSRLQTKVKIINLPQQATVDIYSLDGTLVRHLDKDNDQPYLDWDMYNSAGLPIASGMYLVHVRVYGTSKVIRWFAAMRPLDVTNY